MPRVLIAGCGYVGAATADLFHAARLGGGRLDALARVGGGIGGKPYADSRGRHRRQRRGAEAAAEFDAVIHCASSGGGGAESYRRVYLEGAQQPAREAASAHFHFHEQHFRLRPDRRRMGRRRERGGAGARDRENPARNRGTR